MAELADSAIAALPSGLFLGGEWLSRESAFDVVDPASEKVIARVADATVDDAIAAMDFASAAQESWARTPARLRADILNRAYHLILERVEPLAAIMTAEMGKSLEESRGEIRYAAEFFRWFAEETPRISGETSQNPITRSRILTLRQPVGPCLFITPWNFPLAMGTRKIGPAIAAGCTMVVKPAGMTPLSMIALAAILDEAGLPRGVLNIVTTSASAPIVDALIGDPRLRKLSFTGSTAVGQALIRQAAGGVLRVSMELGGNAPFIVFDDADLDAAVEGAVLAKMRNVGEACTAANRFYAQARIAEEFTRRLAARLSALEVGPGDNPATSVGPLISAKARESVHELVMDAISQGGRLLCGGVLPSGEAGYFYPPTVIADVPATARIFTEEVFGPVAAVTHFATTDEVVAAANDTEYGLAAYVFTRNLERALDVAERLEVGMLGLNEGVISTPVAPFGGIKSSGYGREGGAEGINEYLATKYISIARSAD